MYREAPVRFGSVTVWEWKGSSGSGFGFWWFLCQRGFSVFQYSFTGRDGSGSGFGSWKTVPAVPVQFRFREKRFRRFRFPVPVRFLSHPGCSFRTSYLAEQVPRPLACCRMPRMRHEDSAMSGQRWLSACLASVSFLCSYLWSLFTCVRATSEKIHKQHWPDRFLQSDNVICASRPSSSTSNWCRAPCRMMGKTAHCFEKVCC